MAVAIPDAFGEPRAALRRRVRRDPGRAARVPHLRRRRPRLTRARAGAAHPDLVLRRRRVLARGRARLRAGADRALARRARDRLLGAVRSSTACPGGRSSTRRRGRSRRSHFAERFQLFIIIALGESIVVTGATTSQLSLGVAPADGVRPRVPDHGRVLVALLQLRRHDRAAAARARRRPDDGGARRLHVPPRRARRGDHRLGRRRRARDRASDRDAARRPSSSRSSQARSSTSSATSSSGWRWRAR